MEVNTSVHGCQYAWKYAGEIDALSVHFVLNYYEQIQQVDAEMPNNAALSDAETAAKIIR